MCFFFLFISAFMIFVCKNLIFILIGMEIMNLSLAYKVTMIKNNYMKFFSFLKYSLIQTIFMYMILFVCLFLTTTSSHEVFFFVLMLCKMTIFPSNTWINEIFYSMEVMEFFLLSVITKIPMLLVLLSFDASNNYLMLCILFTFLHTIITLKEYNHMNLMFSFSNLNSSCWMVVLLMGPLYMFFIFFFLYISMMISLIFKKVTIFNNNNLVPFSVLNMASFPLSTMFFVKIFLISSADFSVYFVFFLLLCNSVLIFYYFKYMLSFLKMNKGYSFMSKSVFMIFSVFSFIFFFLM